MGGAMLSRRSVARLAALLLASSIFGSAQAAPPKGPLPDTRAALVPFATAPFPYNGVVPDDGTEFLDVQRGSRLGHTSPRGGIYFEDQTYSDNRVLVALPQGFDLRKKAVMVVFFHGNGATLERDVIGRQRVLDQVTQSGLNAVLVAPQFAVDAFDSSAGRFWAPGAFAQFIDEADANLAALWGSRTARNAFAAMPIIIVAYSGGYDPAAYALAVGGENRRIKGVVLLDAIFDQQEKFTAWIEKYWRSAFFFSAFTGAAASGNAEVERALGNRGIPVATRIPTQLSPGSVVFLGVGGGAGHDDFMTDAWVEWPLRWLLARVPGYPR